MTREEFNASMETVLAFYRRPRNAEDETEFRHYINTLYSLLRDWRADLFDRTCRELAMSLGPESKKPMGNEFKAVYIRLQETERSEIAARKVAEQVATAKPPTPEERLLSMLEEANGMKETGARFVLERAERMGLPLPGEVREILNAKLVEQKGKTS